MSVHESSPFGLREIPGAYPGQPDDGEDAHVASDHRSLSRAVHARKAEYIRQRRAKVRIGSWNVAALPGTEEDLGKWFTSSAARRTKGPESAGGHKDEQERASRATHLAKNSEESETKQAAVGRQGEIAELNGNRDGADSTGDESIDIFVLGLQEIVDVASPAEALRPYVDPGPSNRWKEALQNAIPLGYTLVSSQQLTGLLLLVYASQSIAPCISSISSTSIGTGLMGYMGNKGAVATRIVLGGTTSIVFVNCHLAAGADKASLDRRNWDTSQVVARAKFEPTEEDDDTEPRPNQSLGDEDFAFWFGDLNYRLDDIPGDDVRRLLHLHTENDFGPLPKRAATDDETSLSQVSNFSSLRQDDQLDFSEEAISIIDNDFELHQDPASLETTIMSLLPHDQLRSQQKKRGAYSEGWREGQIRFLPTYKYDVGRVGKFDSSEKQRSPSWCDRILFRTRQDYQKYQKRIKDAEDSRKRDDEMKSLGLDQEAEDASVLFDYDPELDGAISNETEDRVDDESTATHEAEDFNDALDLICYTSHQSIVSSDHKPLHADFVLTYDAVIHDLKAKVHQEVARELDRAENEARPDITVVVDQLGERIGEAGSHTNGIADRDAVGFGQICFDIPTSRSLTLANTSSVPATFSFRYRPVAASEDTRIAPPWLHLRVDWPVDGEGQESSSQKEYTLPPGESAHVQLVLCIFDMDFVRELNIGKSEIEDVLVLRILNGRDHFIPVRGEWLPSCFGLSLEELTQIPQAGVRSMGISGLRASLSKDQPENVRLSAPREIFRLTETIAELTERSVAEWDMVGNGDNAEQATCPWLSERAGWPFDSETWTLWNNRDRYKLLGLIREGLDTNAEFFAHFPPEIPSRHRVELLAETLISFLRSLHDGLVTRALWNDLEDQLLARERSKSTILSAEQSQSLVLEILSTSPAHSVSFTFLTFMLNRIAGEIATLISLPSSPPISPTTPTTPSISSISRASTDIPEPSTTSLPTALSSAARSSIAFPFRFRTRSRTQSSSDGTEAPIPRSRSPTDKAASSAHNAALAKRRAVNKAFVRIFAGVIFSKDIAVPEKDKERRTLEERKRSVIEPFLTCESEG